MKKIIFSLFFLVAICCINTQAQGYRKATITHVTIEKINENHSSGRAWDNYMGNYKPDVFVIIKNSGGKEIWRSPSRYDDLNNEKCPVTWSLSGVGGLEILSDFFAERYSVELWDMDNTNFNDYMQGWYFIPANSKGNGIWFEDNGFQVSFKVRWE
jgi:hypothetical protein